MIRACAIGIENLDEHSQECAKLNKTQKPKTYVSNIECNVHGILDLILTCLNTVFRKYRNAVAQYGSINLFTKTKVPTY